MIIKNYKGIKAVKRAVTVSNLEVMTELEGLRRQAASIAAVDRPAKLGDTVCFDFEGWCGGEKFQGGSAENFELELGSGRFVPGFEQALVGVKPGENRDVPITFPVNYVPELAGKDAVFKCKVHSICEKTLPELNDDFAKMTGKVSTLEELKTVIRQGIEAREDSMAKGEALDTIMDAIIEANPFELDDKMLENETSSLLGQMMGQMGVKPGDFDSFCKSTGMTKEEVMEMVRPSAEKNARIKIIVDAIADQENIVVAEGELDGQIEDAAKTYNMDVEKMKSLLDMKALTEDYRVQKTIDFIYINSMITEE